MTEKRYELVPFGVIFLAAVLCVMWLNEDAFIIFRYVDNLVSGHGLVFNVGERVQGFTCPLYTLALIPFVALGLSAPVAALGINLSATLGLIYVLYEFIRKSRLSLNSAALLCLGSIGSFSLITYQTSGLESPLTTLFAAMAISGFATKRSSLVGAAVGLALINRLDSLFFLWPFLAVATLRCSGTLARLRILASAFVPVSFWCAFSLVYYGSLLPNTALAKVALPGAEAFLQGIIYLFDFAASEPTTVILLSGLMGTSFVTWKSLGDTNRGMLATATVSVLSFLFYIVMVGGDYMEGRFLTPVILICLLTSVLCLDRLIADSPPLNVLGPMTVLASFALLFGMQKEYRWDASQIRSEWHSDNVSIRAMDIHRRGIRTEWAKEGRKLRSLAQECGPFTVHAKNIGQLAYYAGADVSVIDTFGLTDPVIVRMEPEEKSTVGHIRRYGTTAYFEMRGSWPSTTRGLHKSSCLQLQARKVAPATGTRFEEKVAKIELLSKGEIFSAERWQVILENLFDPIRIVRSDF